MGNECKFSNKELSIFKQLVGLNQNQLFRVMKKYLQKRYSKVIIDQKYAIAVGDIPVALVAHLDTVFPVPVKSLYYDSSIRCYWSEQGLGADDRAGVFAVIQIIESGLRPSVIFTLDEEIGGLGAQALAKISCPIPNLKFLIQLDRRGKDDCVFYDVDNPEFTKYIESFGFKTAIGSFSDISYLCPAWRVCGVNLSVGYRNEHTVSETLNVVHLRQTIKKVKNILNQETFPDFEYIEQDYSGWECLLFQYGYTMCPYCHSYVEDIDLALATTADGSPTLICYDCLVKKNWVWCSDCKSPYEPSPTDKFHLCKNCSEKRIKESESCK